MPFEPTFRLGSYRCGLLAVLVRGDTSHRARGYEEIETGFARALCPRWTSLSDFLGARAVYDGGA